MKLRKNKEKIKDKQSKQSLSIKQKPIKTLKLIIDLILVVTLVFLTTAISLSVISKSTGKIPKIGGFQVYSVNGGSMEPNIKMGCVVLIKNSIKNLEKNDIITYLHPSDNKTVVTHRIISVVEGKDLSFITKGDANKNADNQAVPQKLVLGKVIFKIPYLGFLMDFAKSKIGIIVFVLIPCSLIILYQLFKLIWLLIIRRQLKYYIILEMLQNTDTKVFKRGEKN